MKLCDMTWENNEKFEETLTYHFGMRNLWNFDRNTQKS